MALKNKRKPNNSAIDVPFGSEVGVSEVKEVCKLNS